MSCGTARPRVEAINATAEFASRPDLDLSPDGLPVIERVRRPDGLVLLTGLSGHGLALAPVLGRMLAELSLDGRTDHDLTPFRLARFDGPVPAPHRLV